MLTLLRASPFDFKGPDPTKLTDPVLGLGDARALDRIGIETALRNRCLPLEPAGAIRPVACPDLPTFHRIEPHLTALLGPVTCRLKSAQSIEAHILHMRRGHLSCRAERRTAREESCRSWSGRAVALVFSSFLLILLAVAIFWPAFALTALMGWVALTLCSLTGLRLVAALVEFRAKRKRNATWQSIRPGALPRNELPRFSILVPLYDEPDVACRLVERLDRLDYPRDKLEVCLVLEWDDATTETALANAKLPWWMRIVRVPAGSLRTKPRALNYALDFSQSDIVGIYDAEDKPAPDQLRRIAEAAAQSSADVACFQGVLDFYNAKQNWLTRCFAIDYAMWFRLVLPGFVKLGVVIPLGGTTVFFRRAALESMGRWDAHNVTEDADLGIRLARHGYRCRFVPSVTEEEATSTVSTWLRQRSRWIKGYAMTWAVHMRRPRRLLADLGLWKFLCFQIVFLGTLSQFALAPLLWSFWMIPLGLPHPLIQIAPWGAVVALAALFLASEVATMLVAVLAVWTPKHRWLVKWVPIMHLYFPLAAIASWKGFGELISRPFFWDKTAHSAGDVTQKKAASELPHHPHPV